MQSHRGENLLIMMELAVNSLAEGLFMETLHMTLVLSRSNLAFISRLKAAKTPLLAILSTIFHELPLILKIILVVPHLFKTTYYLILVEKARTIRLLIVGAECPTSPWCAMVQHLQLFLHIRTLPATLSSIIMRQMEVASIQMM